MYAFPHTNDSFLSIDSSNYTSTSGLVLALHTILFVDTTLLAVNLPQLYPRLVNLGIDLCLTDVNIVSIFVL